MNIIVSWSPISKFDFFFPLFNESQISCNDGPHANDRNKDAESMVAWYSKEQTGHGEETEMALWVFSQPSLNILIVWILIIVMRLTDGSSAQVVSCVWAAVIQQNNFGVFGVSIFITRVWTIRQILSFPPSWYESNNKALKQ